MFSQTRICTGLSYEKMNRYREILSDNNIKSKVKMKTVGGMHPMDTAAVGAAMSRFKRTYSIYVDKRDAELALHLIKTA